MELLQRTAALAFCSLLFQLSLLFMPAEALARGGEETAITASVAAYYRCEDALKEAKSGREREALRRRLVRMREKLDREGIDYRSFMGVRGQCEDIHGDWFFDGVWMSNTVYWDFLQLFDLPRTARKLAGHPARATDVLPGGGVPDSAFFINREIEASTPEQLIDHNDEIMPRGKITITRKKDEGMSKGFYGKDERGWKYIFIVDPPGMEEQVTGAEVVGSTLVRMAGYNVASSAIVTIHGTENPEFDGRRSVATKLIDGYSGHWSYRAFKNRREIRATRVFGAWLHNSDWVGHNTGISVTPVGQIKLTRYYIFDFGGSLGSWNIRPKAPRDGWVNYVDFGEIFSWPITRPLRLLGLCKKPYDEDGVPFSEAVGYFDSRVRPDRYKPNYPNMAWQEMTREDGLWAARLIASFSEEQIRTAVDLARYSRKEDADYIYRTLLERRRKILNHYNFDVAE